MRKTISAFLVAVFATLTLTTISFTTYAQDPTPVVTEDPAHKVEVDTDTFLNQAAGKIKEVDKLMKTDGVSGFTVFLAILLAVAQMVIQFTKTRFFGSIYKKVGHGGKLAIVAAATVITTAVPLILAGTPITAVLISGSVLSAIMVAGHQIYLAFQKKPAA